MEHVENTPVNILHVGPLYTHRPTGPTKCISELANTQAMMGHNVAVLPSNPVRVDKLSAGFIDKRVTLIPPPEAITLNPWVVSGEWIKKIESCFCVPDIIHIHDTYIPFLSALARRFHKQGWPYTFSPHGGFMKKAQGKKRLKKMLGNFLFMNSFIKHSSKVFLLCRNELEEFGYKTETSIIANGIPDTMFNRIKNVESGNKPRLGHDIITFGFMGRLDMYHKGIDLFLDAVAQLQRRGLADRIKVVFIGPYKSEKDKKKIGSILKKLPGRQNIIFKGSLFGEEKWKEMLKFDVFFHTSRFEGMPNGVLEAMALGKPCLVSYGSNMLDIVSGNECGWGCDGSVESITSVIVRIIEQEKDKIYGFGLNAREYIDRNHLMSRIAGLYVEEYKKIVVSR